MPAQPQRHPASSPPAPAKLSPPRLGAVVPRPRLFKLLDAAARRPVIWLEGPAGSGKTTLAASWVRRRPGPIVWYQVDARDRDPGTFFFYLREAVRRATPRRRDALPVFGPGHPPDLAVFARNFLDAVALRLGAPAILVLDDFQELPEGSPLVRSLLDAFTGVPDGIHVVVLSRATPPPEAARARANGLVATVGWDALRFTDREAARLLGERRAPRLGRAERAKLHATTDGWAAGLVLIGEAARRGEPWPALLVPRTFSEIYDYFSNELFDRADAAVQRLLLVASTLPAITASMADALAGAGAGAHLERLARQNSFTTRREGQAPVYAFHPLFRAFLRARAKAALGPAERGDVLRGAAALLDEAGQPEDAISLFLEAGDGAGASALVRRLAPALERQGRTQTLEEWIRAIPAEVREGDPWMLHWLGVCRMPFDPAESVALQARAFAGFQARGDDEGSLSAAARAIDAIFYQSRDLAQFDPWLAWVEERMQHDAELPSVALGVRVLGNFASALHWRRPSHPALGGWMDRLEVMLRDADAPLRARELGMVAWYRAWTGDAATLSTVLEALERACASPGVPAVVRLAALHRIAFCSNFLSADPAAALARARQGLELAEAEGIHAVDHLLHAHCASAHLSRCDPAAAEPHLDALRRAAGTTDAHLLLLEAWRGLLVGDLDGALASARRALAAMEAGGLTLTLIMAHHALAQVLRARGDAAGAARHLAATEAGAAAARSAVYVWACQLGRARLALDAGDRAACRATLAVALREGRARGFTTVPWCSPALALAGLCEEALDAGLEPEYVRALIRIHALVPDPASPGAERWPFPVKLRALGPFVVEGEAVRGEVKGRSKPLELLKALVALGGTDVPEARLVELVWPDAEGDLGRQRLKYTLHALRGLLGPDAVSLEKGLLSLDPRRVWLDARELFRQLDRLGAALDRSRAGDARDALARAVALRRAPLLDGEPAPWAAAAREKLDARFVRLVLRAAELLRDDGAARPDLDRAAELFPEDARLSRALRAVRGTA